MEVVNKILKYIKTTSCKGLMFKKKNMKGIEAYIDSDCIGSVVDRKFTFGYCIFVRGNLVTWRSKKQGVVARHSAEVEYKAMSLGICERIWLHKVLFDFHQECEVPKNNMTRQLLTSPTIQFNMIELNMWRLIDTSLKKDWTMIAYAFHTFPRANRLLMFSP